MEDWRGCLPCPGWGRGVDHGHDVGGISDRRGMDFRCCSGCSGGSLLPEGGEVRTKEGRRHPWKWDLPALSGVPVVLAEGEVAHFFAPARRAITKKKAVGRTGKSGGVSVRVAKGVSVRSGGGASRTVYNDVTDFFDGQVVLTNRRIVFLAKQGGFDCKMTAISAITPEGDRIMVQAGKDAYRLSVPQQGHFMKVLDAVVRA